MNYRDMLKFDQERDKYKVMCKCGHKTTMSPMVEKKLCSWCGNYIFRTPKAEFRYRIKQKLGKRS